MAHVHHLQGNIVISRMRSVGPGDADVYTQDGRSTIVRVKTFSPKLTDGGRSVSVDLEYIIKENRRDWTTLVGNGGVSLPLNKGMTFIRFAPGAHDADYHEIIRDKQHDWIEITNRPGIFGSVLKYCEIKIDGKGRDDINGNAQLKAKVLIPILVDVETHSGTDLGLNFSRVSSVVTKVSGLSR